jgi:hypothetical protein
MMQRLAHAARWDPRYTMELAGVIHLLLQLAPELNQDVHELVIAMHTDLEAPDKDVENLRRLRSARDACA